MNNMYTVYLHAFPNGKKYVGCTSMPLRIRWDGGLGYMGQTRMFDAILKFGWENIRHYILFESLTRDEALSIEAALIRKWETYKKSKGYNSTIPRIDDPEDFNSLPIKKVCVEDVWDTPIETRFKTRRDSCLNEGHEKIRKPVMLIETGEVFSSATAAARYMAVAQKGISRAATIPGGFMRNVHDNKRKRRTFRSSCSLAVCRPNR